MSTPYSQKFIQWSKRILFTLVFLELVYLIVFNIALNTSYAQKLANKIEPEKLQLKWEYAWTPYPLKIHIKKIIAQSTSRSKHWQADIRSVTATLSPFALMRHEVKVCNIKASDIAYIQKSASSDADRMPVTQNADANQTATTQSNKKETKAWGFALDGMIGILGHHTFKTTRLTGIFDGNINADATLAKRGAPLSIHNGKVHITITSLKGKDGREMLKQGEVKGAFDVPPFVPGKSKESILLEPLSLDANVTAQMENLNVLQPYIPDSWKLDLDEGHGTLQAKARMNEKELNATINLLSKDAKARHHAQHFQSDIDLMINLKVPTAPSLHADLLGSSIALTNTRLLDQNRSQKVKSQPWNTRLAVEKGTVMFPLAKNNAANSLVEIVKKHKIEDLLASAEGQMEISGEISQLEWVNMFLKSATDPSLSGSGLIDADLLIEKGSLANKSTLRIQSNDLEVTLLDYLFKGEGGLMTQKISGGKNPNLKYILEFKNATMKRQSEEEAMVDNVVMRLERVSNDLSLRRAKGEKALRLQILSAKVKKVSLYNQYFPENSPFRFVDGGADLSADIELRPHDAKGYIKFVTNGLTMMIDDQNVSARLNINTNIAAGEPEKMQFDISGSTIVLDQAKVAGNQTDYEGDDWSANLKLTKADIVWKKPIGLQSNALLTIKDSRPIVAMANNGLSKFSFITKALIVENLQGEVSINMADNTITIPSALLKSDKITIGAKGVIGQGIRNGVLYFQLQNLKALLEINNGKKRFDIFNAQNSFESYVLPSPSLPGKE